MKMFKIAQAADLECGKAVERLNSLVDRSRAERSSYPDFEEPLTPERTRLQFSAPRQSGLSPSYG